MVIYIYRWHYGHSALAQATLRAISSEKDGATRRQPERGRRPVVAIGIRQRGRIPGADFFCSVQVARPRQLLDLKCRKSARRWPPPVAGGASSPLTDSDARPRPGQEAAPLEPRSLY